MKATFLFLLAICIAQVAQAQQSPFSSISVQERNNAEVLVFSVPREVNIRHYRIEAGDDSVNFEVISILQPKGNSMLCRTYHYDITAYSKVYYRVVKVEMNNGMPYSNVAAKKKQTPGNKIITPVIMTNESIAIK